MSVMKLMPARNMFASLLEVGAFFLVITPLYFDAIGALYTVFSGNWSAFQPAMATFPYTSSAWGAWAAVLPVWMWVVQVLAYAGLVVIYWAPGDEGLNKAELRGLMMFIFLAVAALLVWLEFANAHHYITGTVETFFSILRGTSQGG